MSLDDSVPSEKYQLLHWTRAYGPLPSGWRFRRLGDFFEERQEFSTDNAAYPLHSFTIENGVTPKTERYDREFLLRDAEANEYKVVRKDDLIFNPMNIRFGAIDVYFGNAPVTVSAYYTIARPIAQDVDLRFVRAYLKSPRLIDVYHRFATGSLIEKRRVHWSVFKEIYVALPPLEQQTAIADILDKWDGAIEAVDLLIGNGERQKTALVQSLLTGSERIPAHRHNKWRTTTFDDIASVSKERFDPKANEFRRCIELEHIEAQTGALLGECDSRMQDSTKAVFRPRDVLFGKLRPYLRKYFYATFDGVCSTEIWVLRAKSGIDPEYLYYLVQTEAFAQAASVSSGSKMPRAEWVVVRDTPFTIPDLAEQRAIVSVVRAAARLPAAYVAQRTLLQSEKRALIQQLLTGHRRANAGRAQLKTAHA